MSDFVAHIPELHPKLSRGLVWCKECGRCGRVNSSTAMQYGWPTCCGYTMTIDSPEERAKMEKAE